MSVLQISAIVESNETLADGPQENQEKLSNVTFVFFAYLFSPCQKLQNAVRIIFPSFLGPEISNFEVHVMYLLSSDFDGLKVIGHKNIFFVVLSLYSHVFIIIF
jgi:hypothetical protein